MSALPEEWKQALRDALVPLSNDELEAWDGEPDDTWPIASGPLVERGLTVVREHHGGFPYAEATELGRLAGRWLL